MNKVTYPQRMTFRRYNATHIIAYLNETVIDSYVPETAEGDEEPEAITGYQYEGPNSDGSYILPCADSTSRDDIINAVIRAKYSESNEFAIQRHHANGSEEYAAEWQEYNEWCEYAKDTVAGWLL